MSLPPVSHGANLLSSVWRQQQIKNPSQQHVHLLHVCPYACSSYTTIVSCLASARNNLADLRGLQKVLFSSRKARQGSRQRQAKHWRHGTSNQRSHVSPEVDSASGPSTAVCGWGWGCQRGGGGPFSLEGVKCPLIIWTNHSNQKPSKRWISGQASISLRQWAQNIELDALAQHHDHDPEPVAKQGDEWTPPNNSRPEQPHSQRNSLMVVLSGECLH